MDYEARLQALIRDGRRSPSRAPLFNDMAMPFQEVPASDEAGFCHPSLPSWSTVSVHMNIVRAHPNTLLETHRNAFIWNYGGNSVATIILLQCRGNGQIG